MSDTTGRRSPTLSECTDATESTIPFWPPREKIPPYNEVRQPSQAVLSTLEHKFVSMKTAYDNFDKWVHDTGDVQAACDAQWDSSSLAKTKPREWVEIKGACLNVIVSDPTIFELVSAELNVLLQFFGTDSFTLNGELRSVPRRSLEGRYYARRLVVAPGLTRDSEMNDSDKSDSETDDSENCGVFWRWKIVHADLLTPEYLLGEPNLRDLP